MLTHKAKEEYKYIYSDHLVFIILTNYQKISKRNLMQPVLLLSYNIRRFSSSILSLVLVYSFHLSTQFVHYLRIHTYLL